jgi:Xaa-Pro aminopeptidase
VNAARLARLRDELDGLGAGSFLVTNATNVRWLSGFESSNAALLVGRERVVLATDYRYIEAARSVEGVELHEAERDVSVWLGARLDELADAPVAFESDHVTVARHEAIAAGGAELVPAAGILLALRATKDDEELAAIRRAAEVVTLAYEKVAEHGFVGHTERDIVWLIERTMREAGAEAASFDAIVGGGPNGALPHHHPGDRVIECGELVVVDAGARVDGYCSDCTRTFATGPLPEELARAYEVCRAAQEDALTAIRPGVNGREVHERAHRAIQEGGFEHLQHGLGHGVGMDVHELPVMREGVDAILEESSVVTVEPGIYLAGLGGVRIEDLVIVRADGPEILTPFTKDLVVLDG